MQEKSTNKLKVLVAVSSGYGRAVLQDILQAEQDLETGLAVASADDLLNELNEHTYDMVLLDNDLEGNERLQALKRIFAEKPAPVMLLVQQVHISPELLAQAIELGVYAVMLKPANGPYVNYRNLSAEVLKKVRAVRDSTLHDTGKLVEQVRLGLASTHTADALLTTARKGHTPDTVVVIGASTGGTVAVESIIAQLPATLQATVLVALHLPKGFTRTFSERLQTLTPLLVREGRESLLVKPGTVIIAPGGRNMIVKPVMGNMANLRISFTQEQPSLYDTPSIDLLMKSVAQTKVRQIIGVILTGMGRDGTIGAGYIRQRGGTMLAQDEETSAIFGMARSAIESGSIDKVLPLHEIPQQICRLVEKQAQVRATDSDYEIERTGV